MSWNVWYNWLRLIIHIYIHKTHTHTKNVYKYVGVQWIIDDNLDCVCKCSVCQRVHVHSSSSCLIYLINWRQAFRTVRIIENSLFTPCGLNKNGFDWHIYVARLIMSMWFCQSELQFPTHIFRYLHIEYTYNIYISINFYCCNGNS